MSATHAPPRATASIESNEGVRERSAVADDLLDAAADSADGADAGDADADLPPRAEADAEPPVSGRRSSAPVSETMQIAADRRAAARAARSFAARLAKEQGPRQLSVAARTLMDALGGEGFDVDAAVRLVEADPLLASRLLRDVNAPVYARREPCKSVRNAVTLLGQSGLRSFATTTAVLSLFDDFAGAAAARVIAHATAVGALARCLAPLAGVSSDEAFTCALLHDVGKLILLGGDDLDYADLFEPEPPGDTMHLVEQERYGYDHATLGAHVLRVWKLPAPIPRIIAWHHQPLRAYASGGVVASMIAVLRVADRIACDLRDGREAASAIDDVAISDGALHLAIQRPVFEALWSTLEQKFHAASYVAPLHEERQDDVDAPAPEEETSALSLRRVHPPPLPPEALAPPAPAPVAEPKPASDMSPSALRSIGGSLARVAAAAAVIFGSSLPRARVLIELAAPLIVIELAVLLVTIVASWRDRSARRERPR